MTTTAVGAAPGVPLAKVAAIGAGFFGITLVWSVYNAYLPLLLARFVDSAALRGAVMGLDNLLALLLIPVVGAWSDRVDGRWGRRLPFVLVGMPLAALAFAVLPFSAQGFGTLIALDVVFLLAMTVFRAPVIALMPDHVAPDRRSTANGVINLMGGVGGLVAFFALAPLYDRAPWLPFALAGALLLVAAAVLARAADPHPPFVAQGSGAEDAAPLRALVRDLRGLWQAPGARAARWALLSIFLYFLGFAAVEAQFTTYAVGSLGLSGGLAGLLLGGFSLAFVVAALPAGLLGTRWGKARTMGYGLTALPVLFVLIALTRSVPLTAAALVLAGLAWAFVNVQAYPLVADLGGRERIGFFTGLYYLVSMSAAVVAPFVLGIAMDVFGLRALFVLAALAMAAGGLALARARALGVDRVHDAPPA